MKKIAIFLPQFHPIPENDGWWGKGFTEWTNVTKAKPLFNGHYQPHLPADLGFYDLRLKQSRLQQEALAKQFGIHGFCYYHYWFNGKRVLNLPLDSKLNDHEQDLPFMLCWANENWTRTWDGSENEILLKQEYSKSDFDNHINFLISVFKDKRYIHKSGKPFFVIYRPSIISNLDYFISNLKIKAIENGFNGVTVAIMDSYGESNSNHNNLIDDMIQFPPHIKGGYGELRIKPNLWGKILNKLNVKVPIEYNHFIVDYSEIVVHFINQFKEQNIIPCVTPMWDNSARKKKNALIILNSTPEKFKFWLDSIFKMNSERDFKQEFLFINAWNEWAEGNHLEPCQKFKLSYLEQLSIIND